MVFLGGCPTSWDVLSEVAGAIADTHEAIELALPGYGQSPPLDGEYTLTAAHEAVEAALLGAGIDTCALVGFSGGAYRALAIALRGVVRVTHLLLLGGYTSITAEAAPTYRELARMVRAGEELWPTTLPVFLSGPFAAAHPEVVAEVKRWEHAAPSEVIAAEFQAFIAAEDLGASLGALRVPVAARVGSADVATPPALSEAIIRACHACPSARLEVVEGAGHAVMCEDPEGTTASLRRLLAT